jgi:small redox-active disulfide protein 2
MKKIQILGTGCAKCQRMTENAEEAAKGLDGECTVEKVTALEDIMMFGVMMTPALVINDEIKVMGRVPSVQEIREMITPKKAPEARRRETEETNQRTGESGNRRNRGQARRRNGGPENAPDGETTNEQMGEPESGPDSGMDSGMEGGPDGEPENQGNGEVGN